MATKELTETDWKTFAVKNGIKETALSKALAALAKAESQGVEAELEALEVVRKQLTAVQKDNKGHKDGVKRLQSMEDAADKREQGLKKQAEQQRKESAEEEEDSPALLGSKMVPLLRELRKGESRMPALICTAGKNTAVLIMRRAIATSRRKLLADAVDAKGGAKYIVGECLMENNALTFVVQAQAAGLAKRIAQALLAQTDMRLRVRVRGDDGQEDQDGENESVAPGNAGSPPQDTAPDADPAAAFNARLAALLPRIKLAMAGAGPQAQDIKLKASEAGTLARRREFDAAHGLLDALEKVLGGGDATSEPGDGAAALRAALQAWQDASEAVDAQLARLQKALKDSGDGELVEIAEFGLNGVSGNFRVRLTAGLMELRRAEGEALRAAATKALPLSLGLRKRLDGDERVAACDDNPFGVKVSIRDTLGGALDQLSGALKQAQAA